MFINHSSFSANLYQVIHFNTFFNYIFLITRLCSHICFVLKKNCGLQIYNVLLFSGPLGLTKNLPLSSTFMMYGIAQNEMYSLSRTVINDRSLSIPFIFLFFYIFHLSIIWFFWQNANFILKGLIISMCQHSLSLAPSSLYSN